MHNVFSFRLCKSNFHYNLFLWKYLERGISVWLPKILKHFCNSISFWAFIFSILFKLFFQSKLQDDWGLSLGTLQKLLLLIKTFFTNISSKYHWLQVCTRLLQVNWINWAKRMFSLSNICSSVHSWQSWLVMQDTNEDVPGMKHEQSCENDHHIKYLLIMNNYQLHFSPGCW